MSNPALTFGLAIASLGVGPLLAWRLETREPLRAALDGFVLVMTAGLSLLFLLPVAVFTFALRNHLLRGVTFGAIRKG